MQTNACDRCGYVSNSIECPACIENSEVEIEQTPAEKIVSQLVFGRAVNHKRKLADFGQTFRFKVNWAIRLAKMGQDNPSHEWWKFYKDGRREFVRYDYE